MLRNRNFLRLFHPVEVYTSRKISSETCNLPSLRKLTLNPHPRLPPAPYRKWHGELTSAELRNLKGSLAKEENSKTGLSVMDEATVAQKHNLREFISSQTSASDQDWDTLLGNILKAPGYLNEYSINGAVMEYCAIHHNLNLAKSYLRYMKKKGKKFNQAVVIEFIRTCHSCESVLTEEDRKLVRSFTNHLIKNFPEMDGKLSLATVLGLSILNEWKKCLEVVEKWEKSRTPPTRLAYSSLILCLFRNQQIELGRKIMLQSLSKKEMLRYQVYIKWIEIFQNDPDRLEELLVIFKNYNVIPKKFVCDYLIQVYSQLPSQNHRKGEYTTIKSNGQCESCMNRLEKNMLQEDEFKDLRDTFLNRVLVGDDVFKNTTPAEVQSFYNVVKAHAPFDVVIDGLNVMYCRTGDVSMGYKSKRLQNVIDMFFKRNNKIFVVGRKHMRKLPKRVLENIMEKSTLFLIDDESEDDPFMIYSTLYSGPRCCFVSNDYLRREKFRLNNHRLSEVFKRWQLSHQISVPKSLNEKFEPRLRFKLCAQKTTPRIWHIPYHDDDYMGAEQYEKDELTTKWLCLRKLK